MSSVVDDIAEKLRRARLVVLTTDTAQAITEGARVVARHHTLGAGDLVILGWLDMRVVIECADADTSILRRFEDEREVERFVQRRLDQYERMWDGCGCRIDYYEEL